MKHILTLITASLLALLAMTPSFYGADSSPISKASVSELICRDPKALDDYRKAGNWLDTIKDSCAARDKAMRDRTGAVGKSGPKQVVSPILSGKDEAYLLTMDVSGQEYLTLRVSDANRGIGADHAVWANAKLTTADGKEVWLDELKPEGVELGYSSFVAAAKDVTIGERKFAHQLYANAPSRICYRLDPARKFKTFETYVHGQQRAQGFAVLGPVDAGFSGSAWAGLCGVRLVPPG